MHSSLREAVKGKLRGGPNCAKYCASDLLPPPYILLQIVLYFLPKKNGKEKSNSSARKAPARGVGESSGERTDAGQSGGKPTRCGTCHWFSPVNGTVARGQVEWMCLTYFPPPHVISLTLDVSFAVSVSLVTSHRCFSTRDYAASLCRRGRSRTCHPVALD